MKLVEIDNKNVALDLVEYLKYNNIQVTLTEEKSLFIIYLNNSDQLFKAKSLIINYQKQKSSNNISDFTSKTNSLVRVIKDNPCTSLFVFISIVFYFIYSGQIVKVQTTDDVLIASPEKLFEYITFEVITLD
jgi:hypothetical protein